MEIHLLGEQIAAYRKAAGLTQDELGRAVGISAQAVSRWECGGAPDITLLPEIAERLGVSIDALFGREKGEQADVTDMVRRWMVAAPREQRVDQLCHLVWSAAGPVMSTKADDLFDISGYEGCCESDDEEDGKPIRWLRRTRIMMESGMILGVRANDMSFVSIWPEPEAGWEAFFEDNERYRALFAALAKPNCIELLAYLHTKPLLDRRHYTPGAVAKAMGLDAAEVEPLMNALAELNVLSKIDLETESGMISAYLLSSDEALVPLLYFARWFITGGGGFLNAPYRKSPMLRGKKREEGKE